MSNCAHCERPARAKGLCNAHYKKLVKYGDPLAEMEGVREQMRMVRYLVKVDIRGPSDCWPWKAHRSEQNYGKFASEMAHRYGFEHLVRPLKRRETVDHLCHNRDPRCHDGDACEHRACQNPSHWEAVPARVNTLRGKSVRAINARKTHCKWGHELTPENSYGYGGRRVCKKCARLAARGQHPRQLARVA